MTIQLPQDMKTFFSHAKEFPENISQIAAESYFREQRASGLIEKQIDTGKTAILLFANGAPNTAYVLENGHGKSLSLAEFSSANGDSIYMRAIQLPDVAGRLTLLALESQVMEKFTITDPAAWAKQTAQWGAERWSGLVEAVSDQAHGFALFWQGEAQKSDVIFSTASGFISETPDLRNDLWEITTYSPQPSTQGYLCAVLRLGAMHWSQKILNRYQELVGQKLLQTMDRELNRQIQPWRWNIALNDQDMIDAHFFPFLMDAAHAYRALFMAMGAQMNFVIGGNLTLRLLNETFEQIHPDERAALQSQRLIPAAFSE